MRLPLQRLAALASASGAALLLWASRALAADPLPRLGGPVVLDGAPDEAAWRAIPPLPMLVYEPVWGSPLEQHTTVRVAYDDEHLYLAAELQDDLPHDVRSGSLYRDRYSGDDTVGLIVDSFDDDRNALWFYTTPAGMRADSTVLDDMASGQSDTSWNGYWESAARRTASGWSAEIRIPFSTLGFQARGGHVTMGLSVYRWLARTGTRHVWPPVPPRWARAYAKPSKLADVTLSGVRSRRAIYFTPYVLAGARARGDGGELERVLEAGADLRTNLLPNLTLDATVNTDFAQVEADDARINLGRFPLFFPEKRQFFLDRADIFAFAWERDNRLFHSRRIGLREGQPLRIFGGTRLAGRVGSWDVGVLDLKTAAPGGGLGENVTVTRVRHRAPGGGSSFGGMLTSRLTAGAGHNVVAAADADVRVAGDEFLTLKAAWSAAEGAPPEGSASAVARAGVATEDTEIGARGLLQWQRRSSRGLSYELALAGLGAAYRSDLGFEERGDVAFGGARATYLWLAPRGLPVSELWGEARGHAYRRNADGRVDSSLLEVSLNAETPTGHYAALIATRATEDVAEPFDAAGAAITPGRYAQEQLSLVAIGSDALRWRPALTLAYGSFYGGSLLSARGDVIINPNPHFDLGLQLETNAIRLGDGQRATTALGRVRVQLALDIHASLLALGQYNEADGSATLSARARYNLREGTDAWLVYDERRHVGRAALATSEALDSRALLVKLNYTFLP